MKKVLFVTYDFPYPTDSGGKTRAYNLIKFAKSNTDITLLSFIRKEPSSTDVKNVKSIGVNDVITVKRNSKRDIKSLLGVFTKNSIFKNLYFDNQIKKKIIEIVREKKIDVVHFESYYTAFYIGEEIRKENAKQILGTENIEHQLYDLYTEKNAPFLTKPILRREVKKIKNEELKMIQGADASVAVTNSELKFLRDNGGKKCILVENGVDVDFFNNAKKDENPQDLLFIGNFAYFPNIDAMQYFYFDILKRLPENISITVVGKGYTSLGIRDKRVKFIDFVEDIREAYQNAFAMVSPIRIGGGTNFKILEAMATHTPVIADPSRVSDIGAKDEKDILIASSAEEFAEKILLLKENKMMRDQIAENAFAFVKTNYAWESIGKKLNLLWQDI